MPCHDLTGRKGALTAAQRKRVTDLMWAQDTDTLYTEFRCDCCCDEHTFALCPARAWNGCKSQH